MPRRRRAGTRRQVTAFPTQPAVIAYGSPPTGVDAYAQPGALVVAGRTNYNHTLMHTVAAGGGTVLLYIDALVISTGTGDTYHNALYNSSAYGAAVPQWGTYQANSTGVLADFRTVADGGGGVLQSKLQAILEQAVADNPHIGGFFADDLGSMSWFPNLTWSSMPTADQNAYRNGALALAQTFRTVCDNHGLMLMVNGTWNGGTVAANGGGYPTLGTHGCSLADGGCIEHHDTEHTFWTPYASSVQWGSASKVTGAGKGMHFAIMATSAGVTEFNGLVSWTSLQPSANYDTTPVTAPWSSTSFHSTGLPSGVRY